MEIYSVYMLAQMFNVSEKTVRKYLKSGKLKGTKIARKWLVHEDALRELLGVAYKQT